MRRPQGTTCRAGSGELVGFVCVGWETVFFFFLFFHPPRPPLHTHHLRWDCHGLPVEYEIDKKLEIKGRDQARLVCGRARARGVSAWVRGRRAHAPLLAPLLPPQVLAMGIDKYNAECRAIVTRYCAEWETVVTRLGRWIDFKNDYRTMEPWYMESVWCVSGGGGGVAWCLREAATVAAAHSRGGPAYRLLNAPPTLSILSTGGCSRPSSTRASCTSRSA